MKHRHVRGEILRFYIVGGAGFIVDAGGVSTLVALHLADPILARAVSFSLAVCLTFLLNRLWTFDTICGSLVNQSIRYLCVQGSGFLINFAVYVTLYNYAPAPLNLPLVAIAIAASAALIVNFIGTTFAVFSIEIRNANPSERAIEYAPVPPDLSNGGIK